MDCLARHKNGKHSACSYCGPIPHHRGLCGNPAATVSTGTSLVQPYDKKQDRRHPTHFRDSGNRSNGTTVHTSCNPVPSSSNPLPSRELLWGLTCPFLVSRLVRRFAMLSEKMRFRRMLGQLASIFTANHCCRSLFLRASVSRWVACWRLNPVFWVHVTRHHLRL